MKKKYQKRSVSERVDYYTSSSMKSNKERLFGLGYADGTYFNFNKYLCHEKDYVKGFNRGKKAKEKALQIKF